MSEHVPLPDGRYEAFVIDIDDLDDGSRRLDLTIIAGDHKGEVLTLTTENVEGEFTDLIGMPATIVVAGGRPNVTIDE